MPGAACICCPGPAAAASCKHPRTYRRHAALLPAAGPLPASFFALLQEYGSGRARLPGLADMPGMDGLMKGGGGGSASSGGKASSVGGSKASGGSSPAAPGAAAGSLAEAQPTLGEYLKFGRLLGERPAQVQQQLELGGVRVRVDEESASYLQVRQPAAAGALLQRMPAPPLGRWAA